MPLASTPARARPPARARHPDPARPRSQPAQFRWTRSSSAPITHVRIRRDAAALKAEAPDHLHLQGNPEYVLNELTEQACRTSAHQVHAPAPLARANNRPGRLLLIDDPPGHRTDQRLSHHLSRVRHNHLSRIGPHPHPSNRPPESPSATYLFSRCRWVELSTRWCAHLTRVKRSG